MSKKSLATLGFVGLFTLLGVTFTALLPQMWDSRNVSVDEALGTSPSPLKERLYQPSATSALPGAINSFLTTRGGESMSFDRYVDGSTEDVHLAKDGWHRTASESYFATLPNGGRRLHSEATFEPLSDASGQQLYKSHKVYRADGAMERFGRRYRDGRYEQTYYFEDGVTPSRDRYFDAMLNFFTETVYRWKADHSGVYAYAKLVRADFEGLLYVSLYREDGTAEAWIKQGQGMAVGSLFAADGTTLVAEWGEDLGQAYYILYDEASREPATEWDSIMGRTTVTTFDRVTHHAVQRQTWQERPDPCVVGGKRYLLMSVSRLDEKAQSVVRINMADNGKHPAEVITEARNSESVEKLDASGEKIVKKEVHDASGAIVPSLLIDMPIGAAVNLDPTLLAMPERPSVPTFTDNGPPRLYDYSEREVTHR